MCEDLTELFIKRFIINKCINGDSIILDPVGLNLIAKTFYNKIIETSPFINNIIGDPIIVGALILYSYNKTKILKGIEGAKQLEHLDDSKLNKSTVLVLPQISDIFIDWVIHNKNIKQVLTVIDDSDLAGRILKDNNIPYFYTLKINN